MKLKPRPRFNSGAFFACAIGASTLTSAFVHYMHRELHPLVIMLIGFSVALVLAVEAAPREKSKPDGGVPAPRPPETG